MNIIPLVDVAMVTYNHEKYVAQAIESVLVQQTDFDFRLIIGDDCSTDNTQAIIRLYKEKYPDRIETILLSEHLGIYHENRVGLQVLNRCTAKYVALLDGDDNWTDPSKLTEQVRILEGDPTLSFCYHSAEFIDNSAETKRKSTIGFSKKARFCLEDLLRDWPIIPTSSLVYRRENLVIPSWFHEFHKGDRIVQIFLASQGDIAFIDKVMAVYRRHRDSITTYNKVGGSEFNLDANLRFFKKIDQHFGKKYHSILLPRHQKFLRKRALLYAEQNKKLKAIKEYFVCVFSGSVKIHQMLDFWHKMWRQSSIYEL